MIEFAVIGAAMADRFLLKRNQIKIIAVERKKDDANVRFNLKYSCPIQIRDGVLTYSLRSKSRPSAVLFKTHKLDFSDIGLNEEFLVFNKAELEQELGGDISGDWTLNVRVERSHSRINPLYKIIPLQTHYKEVISIA